MLKTFDSSTMTELPSEPSTESSDDFTTPTYPAHAIPQPAILPEPPRRRQRRSCDSCRRGKRACDAEKCADFANQTCSNCHRKNQVCTFNWLKTASENHQDRERKRRRSSFQSSNGYTEGSASTRSHSFQGRPRLQSSVNNTQYELPDRSAQWLSSLGEGREQDNCFNMTQMEDAEDRTNDAISFDELSPVQSRKSARPSFFKSCRSGRSSFDTGRHRRYHKDDSISPFRDILLGERSSRGFVTNGLLRIYNDSMENSLSCWLTEHNCPYTIKHYRPSSISAKKASREWGSSWSNRMYNRVIQLDRAYASLRIRTLTAEEERTVSKALNMAIVAFASQWAQAGERGTRYHATDTRFMGDEFPQSNEFERSMQESLWHQTSELLHRAARIDSFRVVFALIIFSLTQRPLDVTRPLPRPDRKSKIDFNYFQSLIQDDDAPVFLETALRQILAQRRKLERLEREVASRGNGEPKDPLSDEDRDTFNLLYWLGVMFDTLSAAICERAVVVDDEDCELPQPDSHKYRESPSPVPPKMYGDQFTMADNAAWGFGAGNRALPAPREAEVWGDLFTRDGSLEVDPEAARWPCSYKVAAATLSSAAPVKVLLFRRVAHLQALVSRKVSPSRIESAINAAFQVYNHWTKTYAPFFSDCVQHHATLPQRVQSWYILLAGHWHLATFLLSDLLCTIDATKLSLPNERTFRQASNLVATLRRQNALAVADLSLASIHSASQSESAEDFHFALNQAALLTEPWTVVFVRSLCRAGYVLVQIAADDPSEEEREQARRRCGDCIEGLWYLGRKSDMAFLAARCLTDMLDEAIRDTTTSNMTQPAYEEEGSDGMGTASSQFGTDPSPQTIAEMAGYQQPFEQIGAFPEWSAADLMASCQVDNGLNECEVLNLQTPLELDSATLWDFSLQC